MLGIVFSIFFSFKKLLKNLFSLVGDSLRDETFSSLGIGDLSNNISTVKRRLASAVTAVGDVFFQA